MKRILLALLLLAVAPPSPKYVGPAKWKGGATNKPIKRIVIHCTVGAEPGSPDAAMNTVRFSKQTTRPSSYHYIADSDEHFQYVFDGTVAFHAPPNEGSLGYELCCSLSNEGKGHWGDDAHQSMLKIVAEDVARLCLAYDVPIQRVSAAGLRAGQKGLCGHNTVRDAWHQTDHWDPGPYFPWQQFVNLVQRYADALLNPEDPSRGSAVDHALADLRKAARRAQNRPLRLQKIRAAIDALRTIKAR
jgi:hypothetical protein